MLTALSWSETLLVFGFFKALLTCSGNSLNFNISDKWTQFTFQGKLVGLGQQRHHREQSLKF